MNQCMGTRQGRIEVSCSLPGETSLTGPPDRSDRSMPANCSSQQSEQRSSHISCQKVNASSSISWGHVLQAVRKFLHSFHFIFYSCALWQRLWSDLIQFLNWIKCIKRNSKLLCTYLGGDHFAICVFGTNIFLLCVVVSHGVDYALYGSNVS